MPELAVGGYLFQMNSTPDTAPAAALTPDDLDAFSAHFTSRPELKRMQNAVVRVGIDEVALDNSVVTSLSHSVSHRLDDWDVTNQKKSGRCWLFAALNLLRSGTRKRLGVKNFEFSQNHAMYFDKLERANFFFESMLATSDLAEEDRLVSFLLANALDDGGQWDMIVSLFTKHGVVPKTVMPETKSSSDTRQLNIALQSLARYGAQRLRGLAKKGAADAELQAAKKELLADVHSVLSIHLGTPPTTFDWQWTDDEKVFHRDGELTPQQFYAKYVTFDLTDYVCLVDDPRSEHRKGEMLTVEHLGNVVGGQPIRYLNVDIEVAKTIAMETIVDGEPVWFGCDCDPQGQDKLGLWDSRLFDHAGVYGAEYSLDKESRVRYQESAMTHAMLLVGVDVVDGRPRRWRVENSWGKEHGEDGFYTMSDSWFEDYVFEVVVNRSRLPEELRASLGQEPRVLPAWDPMGALA
jgi:bleomycin hydrolase